MEETKPIDLSQELITLGEMIGAIAERAYPGMWDLTYEKEYTRDTSDEQLMPFIKLTVHFPVVHVTNSVNEHHTLTDMYIHLTVTANGKFLGKVKGERATMSYHEWQAKYNHSHLMFYDDMSIGNFCMADNNIEHLSSDIRRIGYFDNATYFMRRFEAILLQMNEYLAWESIEGSRFCHINTVGVATRNGNDFDYSDEAAAVMNNIIRDTNVTQPPLIIMDNKGFQLSSYTEEFEEWLVKYAIHKQVRLPNGKYVNVREDGGIGRDGFSPKGSTKIKFKGQEITKYVNGYSPTEEERQTVYLRRYCHREVKDKVVDNINGKLYRNFIEKSVARDFKAERDAIRKTPFYNTFNGRSEAENQRYRFLQSLKTVPDVSES